MCLIRTDDTLSSDKDTANLSSHTIASASGKIGELHKTKEWPNLTKDRRGAHRYAGQTLPSHADRRVDAEQDEVRSFSQSVEDSFIPDSGQDIIFSPVLRNILIEQKSSRKFKSGRGPVSEIRRLFDGRSIIGSFDCQRSEVVLFDQIVCYGRFARANGSQGHTNGERSFCILHVWAESERASLIETVRWKARPRPKRHK
ncbi:hypothetical protein KCV03_g236, partial [Aureobasidium melanogenum]